MSKIRILFRRDCQYCHLQGCDLVRRLKDEGYCVEVVMTEDAMQMIRPVVFQSLSGNKVIRGCLRMSHLGDRTYLLSGKSRAFADRSGNRQYYCQDRGDCDDLLSCVAWQPCAGNDLSGDERKYVFE